MPRVASSFLLDSEGLLLILKRSDKVRTYRGLWSGVAGYVEESEKPIDTAYKEIQEEVSIDKEDLMLIKQGSCVRFTDFYDNIRYDWEVFPFLFRVEKKDKLIIDWEHTEYRWIKPSDIDNFEVVPHLKDIVSELLF